ncbi:MAG: hypothetical protein WCE45_09010, partial [Sedimentisphaerales bacterium]
MVENIIMRWFWVVFIVVTFINAAIFKVRASIQIQKNPDLREGYRKIIKGFVIWTNIPWIVMGAGCTI